MPIALGLALAALSLLVVAPAPSYDPWAWLLWGRELAGGGLSTAEGPAFKPLPVAVCALLAPLGDAAPTAWVLIGRLGALLAIWLAFRLARRLSGGSLVAGALAAAGVAFCGAFLSYAAAGAITGWVVALALAGVEAWRAGRPRLALACGLACGLLQVEAWPFLLVLGIVLWRRRTVERPLLVAAGVALPALWLAPELLGSGDLLRSAARARVPNPGQPALADVPGLASLGEALGLLLWPLWAGLAALAVLAWRGRTRSRGAPEGPPEAAHRVALLPAAAGLAWVAVVATMAQLGGFSGEPRYALPGMAVVAISGAVGLVVAVRPPAGRAAAAASAAAVRGRRGGLVVSTAVAAALVALALAPRLDGAAAIAPAQAHQWELARDLADAVRAAGGADAVLRCGAPYVGPLRGPLMAYELGVEKRSVEPDLAPAAPAVVFRSRLGEEFEPRVTPGFHTIVATEHWHVLGACRG